MSTLRVPLIQGGGAGLDQIPAVKRVLKAAGVQIEWQEFVAGLPALELGQPAVSPEMLRAIREAGYALKTKILPPPGIEGTKGAKASNFNVQFRHDLGLFASVRPLKNLPGLPAHFQNVDILVIRELTEDLYAAIEHEIVPGVVQSMKVVTEASCRRFFRFALEWARKAGRKQVHCVHKANILKMADGLFLEAFRAAARDFPELQTREIIVDNCCMQMVSRPQQFDVMVMGNLYGDLVSDLGAGVVGGVSATHGINVGDGVRVYECFHGGPREEIGVDQANPLPLILPAIDLLEGLGQSAAAARVQSALATVLTQKRALTRDLGGSARTSEMTDAIVAALPT
jgi:isocitrate dehydrogenase (NAD+)